MDFVFNCAACHGPLIARTELRGRPVACGHCGRIVEIGSGRAVTEAVVGTLLDLPLPVPPDRRFVLRRVRPAVQHTSLGSSRSRPAYSRGARISRAN